MNSISPQHLKELSRYINLERLHDIVVKEKQGSDAIRQAINDITAEATQLPKTASKRFNLLRIQRLHSVFRFERKRIIEI